MRALASDRWPFGLEKWYIDTLLPDGTVLLVYLARMSVFGVHFGRVTAELFSEGGQRISGTARVARDDIHCDDQGLRFGPATVSENALAWRTDGLSGELSFRPRREELSLRDPFLESGGHSLRWWVEVPDADVEGTLEWPGGQRRIQGRGYRDRVWFDFPPWSFPIRTLRWGRAVCGPRACTWVEAETRSGRVAGRWVDGVSDEIAEIPAELSEDRVILESGVVDLDSLKLGFARPLLRALSGDPHEIKWAVRASMDGHEGRGIHEVVRWR